MTLKERIKDLANSQGLSLPNLEAKLGFGNGTILKWDKSIPNTDKLTKVADYFQVSVDYLLGRENKKDDLLFLRGADELTQEERDELKKILQMSADVYLKAKGLI